MTTHLADVESRTVYDPEFGLQEEWWAGCECGWVGAIWATVTDATTEGEEHCFEAIADEAAAQADELYDRARDESLEQTISIRDAITLLLLPGREP